MPEPALKYCPVCATPLVEKHIAGALRPTCPECGFITFLDPKLVTVEILLGKRNINPGKGLWSFFSGYVNRGEQVEEAAIREVKEETNLDVQLDGLIGVYSERGTPHVLVAYQASVVASNVNGLAVEPEEVSELAFFAWEELPELAFPFDKQILHDWRKNNLRSK